MGRDEQKHRENFKISKRRVQAAVSGVMGSCVSQGKNLFPVFFWGMGDVG